MPKFDLASLDTRAASSEGRPLVLLNRSRQPLTNDDGTEVSISFFGQNSDQFRRNLRSQQEARRVLADQGKAVTGDFLDREQVDTLIACTASWNFDELDGAPFPCSPQNVVKFWNDPRFVQLHAQAISFILDASNFLPASAGSPPSSDTAGSSSSSLARFPTAVPSVTSSGTSG